MYAYVITIHQRYRQTDGRTDGPRYVLRAVIKKCVTRYSDHIKCIVWSQQSTSGIFYKSVTFKNV